MLSFIHLVSLTNDIIKPFIPTHFKYKFSIIPSYIDQYGIAYNYDTLLIHVSPKLELFDLKTYVKLTSLTVDNVKRVVGFYDNLIVIVNDGIYSIMSYGTMTLILDKDMSTYKKLCMDADSLYIILEHEYIVMDSDLDYSIHLRDEYTHIMGRNKHWNLYFTELDDISIQTKNKIYFRDQVIDTIGEGWIHCLNVGISQRNYNELYSNCIVDNHLETTLLFQHRLVKVIGFKSSYVVYTTNNHPNHLVIYSLKRHRITEILFFKNEVLEIFNDNIHNNTFRIVVDNSANFYIIIKGKTILNTQWSYDIHRTSYVLPVIETPAVKFCGFEDISLVC